MPRPSSTAAILVLLTLIWGSTWAAIRIGLTGIPPFTGATLRFILAAAVLLLVARLRRVPLGRDRRERRVWWANGLLSFTVSYGVVYWAEQTVPSGLAAIIFGSFPLFVALLAHFYLPGERLTPTSTAGVVLGFVGLSVLYSEDLGELGGPGVARAAVILLLAPLAAASGQILVKRWGKGIHPLSITAVPMGMAAALLGTLAVTVEGNHPLNLTPAAIGSVVYLAIVGTALAFSLYFYLLEHMQASRLALIAYVTPAVAVALGTLLLEEPFTLHILLGAATILVGVALASRRRHAPDDAPADVPDDAPDDTLPQSGAGGGVAAERQGPGDLP